MIGEYVDATTDALAGQGAVADDAGSLTAAYRTAVDSLSRRGQAFSSDSAIEDRPGIGAAKNDQSIVIRVEADGSRALLSGDMQFAEAEVTGLDQHMQELLPDRRRRWAVRFCQIVPSLELQRL